MIRKLPPDVIREIAAGEVVTAPVDIVKELVENALDAGATRLELSLRAGGRDGIVVSDNGVGVAQDELPLTVEAHSTSKLTSLGAISTLGFRGEGLYAICHSARLSLTSRPAAQLGGACLSVDGDEVTLAARPAAAGTQVEVSELFARLPARRAALDSPAHEERKVVTLLHRYLLHHPRLRLRLRCDHEERLNHAGGTAAEVVKLLWGPVTANRLLSVTAKQEEMGGETGEAMALEGLLSRPELSRPRRDRLLLAVNGRPVAWPEALLLVLTRAYREMLPSGHHPVGVLNLTLDPARVLVNTSPDKRRVRLLDEAAVAAFVESAVQQALAETPLAPPLPAFRPGEGVTPAPRHHFPTMRHLGTYRELYLLAEADAQLWVVDQHAAHERVLFEELARRYQREPPVELTQPELLPLSLEDETHYRARAEALAQVGVVLEPFGGGVWRVRQVPRFLLGHPELLAGVVKESLGRASVQEAWRVVLARLACLPAIKAGHDLNENSAQALLAALAACETPWVCPHGRPTALVLSELDLSRRFGRSGPRVAESKRVNQNVTVSSLSRK